MIAENPRQDGAVRNIALIENPSFREFAPSVSYWPVGVAAGRLDVARDTEQDNFMTAEEALQYGLIDRIIDTR